MRHYQAVDRARSQFESLFANRIDAVPLAFGASFNERGALIVTITRGRVMAQCFMSAANWRNPQFCMMRDMQCAVWSIDHFKG